MSDDSREERIAQRIDPDSARSLTVSERTGSLAFHNASQAMEFAKMMAIGHIAVPKHLRGNPGACLAIVLQSVEWGLSPFAVANKSYAVNDRLAYESQLIQAIVLKRAPINGRFQHEFSGEGLTRVCRVWATLKDSDAVVDYCSPPIGRIAVQNSPLWKGDPDQQLYYYSTRAFCRRHFPDVLLGIYAREDLEAEAAIGPDKARDVTPPPEPSLMERLDALAADQPVVGPTYYPEPTYESPEPQAAPSASAAPDPLLDSGETPEAAPDASDAEEKAFSQEEILYARRRGAAAFKAGHSRRDLPVEYRRTALQLEFQDGYDSERDRAKAESSQ